jgi:hypothetical protein
VKLMRFLAGILGGLSFIGAMVFAYLSGIHRSYDRDIGLYVDGLNRVLSEVPLVARFFVPDSLWAGLGLYIMDVAIFFSAMAFALFLGSLAGSNTTKPD